MATSASPPSLLPPYVPSPAFSSSFPSSSLHNADAPFDSPSAVSDYFGGTMSSSRSTSHPTPDAASTSPSHAFFGRLRSSSLHSSHPASMNASAGPSGCSSPSTPMSLSSGSDYLSSSVQSTVSTAPSSLAPPSPPVEAPYIRSVTVPHVSGSGKHGLFACRVVPDLDIPNTQTEKAHSRRASLGKMRLAGTDEPHTVWRSWQDCLDFSTSLSAAFPDGRPESPSSTATFPTTRHKVPRLHGPKKLTNVFKSSSHGDRQADLEAFFAQLFSMSPSVRHSPLVRDFFCPRPHDAYGREATASISSPSPSRVGGLLCMPQSVPDWLVAGDQGNDLAAGDLTDSTDATNKAPRPRIARPALATKTSSPDLRGTVRGFANGADLFVPSPLSTGGLPPPLPSTDFLRPSLAGGSSTPDRDAFVPTSTSSRTITPLPDAQPSTPSGAGGFAKTLKKKASGGLRHIRSLGDLRGSSKKVEAPSEPVPSLSPAVLAAAVSSVVMDRAATQPVVSSRPVAPMPPLSSSHNLGRPLPSPSTSMPSPMGRLPPMPHSAPLDSRHRRSGSSKSSTTSFEDLWGTPFPTAFRQTTTGRVECVRDPHIGVRRPSLSTSAVRPSLSQSHPPRPPMHRSGHKPSSASISSIESARSGDSSGSLRSLAMSLSRSSAGSEMCPTPPTPMGEWSATAGDKASERVVAGKFYVENGVLHENNRVPPPPFFPVPPPMQYAYSHDGLPHTPRSSGSSARATHVRKSSTDQQCYPPTPRSRTGSMASSRRVPLHETSLDAILASPTTSSAASSPRTVGGARASWTFKLLHRDENVVLRVSKPVDGSPLPLARLRQDIEAKFKSCGVRLSDGASEWGLAWTMRGSGGTKLLISQDDLNACLCAHDESTSTKIVLKVIC